MNDLIERSAVIDLIDKYTQDMSTDYWTANYGIPSDVFEDEIMELPSVQPEHKMGRWIVRYECPSCGEGRSYAFDTCPMCGADMRGEQNDSISD